MLDVHEQQFLVLLLMVQAEFDGREQGRRGPVDDIEHAGIHGVTVVVHLVQRGTCDQAAPWPRVLPPDAVVIAVVEFTEGRVMRTKAGFGRFEHEGLEEPGDVREVPFGGARIGHRLHTSVFGRERCGERFAGRTDRAEAFAQRGGIEAGGIGRKLSRGSRHGASASYAGAACSSNASRVSPLMRACAS